MAPITGTFAADFSDFKTAVEGATENLRQFETGSGKVQTQLEKMGNAFSGQKIISDAILMTEAIQRAGGVTTLTANELQRAGSMAAEAAEKMRALGQTVPPGLQAIADTTKAAHAEGRNWLPSLDDLGASWVARVAEGMLLRDAIRLAVEEMKKMAEFFPELALRGAVVNDVEEAFQHLTKQSGLLSDELLTTLRGATHGTVDDFALMQRANKDLAAGVDLTDKQFGTLAAGAFALAKATGGDAKEALDKMSDAMVTGRTKGIALLTGKIDLKAAEEDFAKSLGATVDELSTEGKLEADREAILKAVEAGLVRVGEQHLSLKDRVEQGQVAWENFKDELGKVIAKSPVLESAFVSIQKAIGDAFGPSQDTLIQSIAHSINTMAFGVVDMGIATVETARVVHTAWSGVETVINAAALVVVGTVTAIGEAILATDRIAAALHLVPDSEVAKVRQTQQYLRDLTGDIAANTVEAGKGVVGMSAFDQTLDTVGGTLMVVRDGMVTADAALQHGTTTAAGFVGPIDDVGEGAKKAGNFLKDSAASAKAFADAVKEVESVGLGWKGTIDTISGAVVEEMRALNAAGVSMKTLEIYYGLTTAQGKAFVDMLKDEGDVQKLNDKIAADSAINWAQYFKDLATMSGTAYDHLKADTQQWLQDQIAKHVLAKTDTADFYNFVYAEAALKDQRIEQNALQADVHSKAHFEKIAADAQAAYQFATDHSDQYTSEWIAKLRQTADEAALAASRFGMSFDKALGAVDAHIATTIDGFHQLAMASAVGQITAGDGVPDSVEKRLKLFSQTQAYYPGVAVNPSNMFAGITGLQQFAGGGSGDFGSGTPVMLHGRETISLTDKPAGPNVNVTINVNGTAADVARKVASEILRTVKQGGAQLS